LAVENLLRKIGILPGLEPLPDVPKLPDGKVHCGEF
jgi:hypothetical protein